ncbi:hypothetical protein FACS1894172_12630 [Spirochaetia bacterium]|nr:hypothetical protein FACS1894172_12630 [Spirochaetia bacterium]
MNSRIQKIGIKQTIQKHWMDKTVQMMLSGLTEKEIRANLDDYLSTQKTSGGIGERGKSTYKMAIGILASWFAPEDTLIPLRDDALKLARSIHYEKWLPLHWAILSASYPFWFNVALQSGRLFNLQEYITQNQIFGRLKEQYGDRETVARNARYTIRSLIAWNVMYDTEARGCYGKVKPMLITDINTTILLLESALHTIPDSKASFTTLLNNPAFFPFEFPSITGDILIQNDSRIRLERYSLNDEYIVI